MSSLADEMQGLECSMRRKGRTSFLVSVLEKDSEAFFITHDLQSKKRLQNEYPDYRNRILSVGELMRMRGMTTGPVIFDHTCFELYCYRVTKAWERVQQGLAELGSAIHHV